MIHEYAPAFRLYTNMMKTRLRIFLVLGLIIVVAYVWLIHTYPFFAPGYRNRYNAEDYAMQVHALSKPTNASDMIAAFDALYPYWLGTRWDFNGTTQIPGSGNIACGYFVTTLIEDMHMPIERIAMAQCASEEMIKNQVDADHITRYNAVENDTMFSFMHHHGDALYIIGLDNHTGFLRVQDDAIWFIHSSGRFPFRVIKENAESSKTILSSRYKVIGRLSDGAVYN